MEIVSYLSVSLTTPVETVIYRPNMLLVYIAM